MSGVGYELSKQEYMSLRWEDPGFVNNFPCSDWSSNNELHFGNQNIS